MDTPMTKEDFNSMTGEDPEDVFGADWENDVAELTEEI
jgi:hypothetical protein